MSCAVVTMEVIWNNRYTLEERTALGTKLCDTKDVDFSDREVFLLYDTWVDNMGDGPMLNRLAKGRMLLSESFHENGLSMYKKQAYLWWGNLDWSTASALGQMLKAA